MAGAVVQVLVTVFSEALLPDSLRLAAKLHEAGIKAEAYLDPRKNLGKQLGYAEGRGIPLAAILGEDEVQAGVVKLKYLSNREEATLPRGEVAGRLQNRF